MFDYIDIHAHLNDSDFDSDRDEVIDRMKENKIGAINVGTNITTSKEVVELASLHDNLWAIVGVHPHEPDENFETLAELGRQEKVVAIGECGLDYSRIGVEDKEIKKQQQELFAKQIELALTLSKPLMLHVRDSYQEVLDILKSYPKARAHVHFFAGDWAMAKKFLDRGDSLSFTGVITFTKQYDEVVKNMPLDRLLAETDCPYVAPIPYRGKRNEPTYVVNVVKKIAAIRGEGEKFERNPNWFHIKS